MPTLICISIFGNRLFSTSLLILLSINGLSILWSCFIISLFLRSFSASDSSRLCLLLKSNQSSKSSDDANISGSRKFIKLQSSCKLFWSGVPVNKRRYFDLSCLIRFEVWLSSFLILWASSMMIYSQLNFYKALIQILTPSKVVMHTSNFPGYSSFFRISSLCSFLAIRLSTLHWGSHLLNSAIQLPTTDLGIKIKWTPLIDLNSRKKLINEIVWTVLPRPISSAKMPLIPVS